jgi:hypothetical protein
MLHHLCVQIYIVLKFGNEKHFFINMINKNLQFDKVEYFWHIKFIENVQIKQNSKSWCVVTTVLSVPGLLLRTQIRYEYDIYALSCIRYSQLHISGTYNILCKDTHKHTHTNTGVPLYPPIQYVWYNAGQKQIWKLKK